MPTVENLNFDKIRASIAWRGLVHLAQTGEDDESLLGLVEWPKKHGQEYLVCSTSGLLFDKQTGRCVQSPRVWLRLESLIPASPREHVKFATSRKKRDYGYCSKVSVIEV